MKRFYQFIKWFQYITPEIIFVYAINVEISGDDMIPVSGLWQVLLSGLLTALVTIFLVPREETKKWKVFVNILLHYVMLCAVMIGCGCWFGWMDFDAAGIMMMLVSVAAVYFLAFFLYYLIDIKQANEINQKLKEKYGDKD